MISLIAALARNHVIGHHNRLPWHLPDDMKYFMQKTKGHPVIMGRRNYESIPEKFRPLPNRTNIVITRQRQLHAPGCAIVHSLDDALGLARLKKPDEIFVIGGAEIYRMALPLADRLYLTEIDASVPGDTYFPAMNAMEWREISREHHHQDERHAHAFDFVVYDRIS